MISDDQLVTLFQQASANSVEQRRRRLMNRNAAPTPYDMVIGVGALRLAILDDLLQEAQEERNQHVERFLRRRIEALPVPIDV